MYEYILKLKSKKGMSTIEIVIGVMIFILIFAFMLDLIVITWKFNVIAQTNTQIARIAGLQGGIRSTVPSGWPGGAANYVNTAKLNQMVRDAFSSAGIKDGEYTISVPVSEDYGSTFQTVVTVNYTWQNMSAMLPGTYNQTITSKRPAISEWKYDYTNWGY